MMGARADSGSSFLRFFRLAVLATALISAIVNTSIAEAGPTEPNILILNSYSRDLRWTDDQTRGILEAYRQAYVQPVFYIEYLDWKNYPSLEHLQALRQMLESKYAEKRLDIVMTTDDAALKFALQYRDELFPGTPVVYSGIFPDAAASLTGGYQNVAGVHELLDVKGTVELAKELSPDLTKLFLIYDNSESGFDTGILLKKGVAEAAPGLEIESLNLLSYQEIIAKLRTAPKNSAVLLGTYSQDINGKIMDLEQYARLFAENSNIPVYILYDFEMGRHVVGGSLIRGALQGQWAADLGIQILMGVPVDSLRTVDRLTSAKIIDYLELQRYDIPYSHIPADAEVLNNPLSFYEQNKQLFWATTAIFLLMIVYIIVLMANIRRRRTAERQLRKSNEELTALYEEVAASQEELQAQYSQLETMQAALGESEERYKLSVDGANDGLWDWDLHANQVYLSKRCLDIFGLKTVPTGGLKDLLTGIIPLDERDYVLGALDDHLSGKTAFFACEHRIDANGRLKWLLTRGKTLIVDGKPVRMAGSITDITERKQNEAQIHFLAFHDALTGLWNRAALNDQLDSILRQRPKDTIGAVLFVDIDNFKDINDAFGHTCGDKLLVAIARLLENNVGKQGFVARMGGDEFVVLQEVNNEHELEAFMNSFCDMFNTLIEINDRSFHVTVSIGGSEFPAHGSAREELLRRADLAMYEAKKRGLNQLVLFTPSLEMTIRERMELEKRLREAVVKDEFRLWYQPVLQVATGKILAFEALVRWYHPDRGIIMPKDFIPLAEETGMIIPIGQTVLEKACRMLAVLHDAGQAAIGLTVNISVMQILQPDFVEAVRRLIRETGISAASLGFEITESVLMECSQENLEKLREIKAMGISIYLDDFGTGYSSLGYLDSMPIDVLKIDKSFVDCIGKNEGRQLTKLIIRLAHQMKIQAVAEGVETQEQMDKLRQYRCDSVQGYLVSKPLPEEQVMAYLRRAGLPA